MHPTPDSLQNAVFANEGKSYGNQGILRSGRIAPWTNFRIASRVRESVIYHVWNRPPEARARQEHSTVLVREDLGSG